MDIHLLDSKEENECTGGIKASSNGTSTEVHIGLNKVKKMLADSYFCAIPKPYVGMRKMPRQEDAFSMTTGNRVEQCSCQSINWKWVFLKSQISCFIQGTVGEERKHE